METHVKEDLINKEDLIDSDKDSDSDSDSDKDSDSDSDSDSDKDNDSDSDSDKDSDSDSDKDSDKDNDNLIDNYDRIEKYYDIFYKNVVETVKVYYIYIEEGEITSVKKDILILNNGVLEKDLLRLLIEQKSKDKMLNKKYDLLSILKFNIDIEQEDIEKLLDDKHLINKVDILNNRYFQILDNTLDIKFNKIIKFNDTIDLFQDVNSLYFLFKEKKIKIIKKTLKNKYKKSKAKTRVKRLKDVNYINNNGITSICDGFNDTKTSWRE